MGRFKELDEDGREQYRGALVRNLPTKLRESITHASSFRSSTEGLHLDSIALHIQNPRLRGALGYDRDRPDDLETVRIGRHAQFAIGTVRSGRTTS